MILEELRKEAGPYPSIENYFVCIGAQKAGTTWLARALSGHPELFVTPVKEIHYFDHVAGLSTQLSDRKRRSRLRKYWQRRLTQWTQYAHYAAQRHWYRAYMREPIDDDWYKRLFAYRGSARFAGEATPEYALLDVAGFSHLQRLAPEAKIIFILRNPVTRSWSQVLHLCRRQHLDATRLGADQLIAMASDERVRDLSDYRRTLEALDAVFRSDQVHVGFYEDIHADRSAALALITGFIGVSAFPESRDLAKRYNRSQEAVMPEPVRLALVERSRELTGWVGQRFGRLPNDWRETFGG